MYEYKVIAVAILLRGQNSNYVSKILCNIKIKITLPLGKKKE